MTLIFIFILVVKRWLAARGQSEPWKRKAASPKRGVQPVDAVSGPEPSPFEAWHLPRATLI